MMELVEGSIVENLITEEQHFFHEGSSMRKRGDTYYLVYACMERGKPTSLGYATSKSPLGPFEYKGIIVDNDGCDPQSWNNHGSIEEINGHWYVFYHRSSRNSRKSRRMCIEPITFNEDGTINEVRMTSQGAGRAFGLGEPIHAFRACGLTGNCHIAPDGNLVEGLVGIKDGDTAVFRYVDWAADALEVAVKAFGSGVIGVYLDGSESAAGQIVLKDGEVVSSEVKSAKGKHEILIKFSDVQDLTLHAITFK
jgi:hypothetical protein